MLYGNVSELVPRGLVYDCKVVGDVCVYEWLYPLVWMSLGVLVCVFTWGILCVQVGVHLCASVCLYFFVRMSRFGSKTHSIIFTSVATEGPSYTTKI